MDRWRRSCVRLGREALLGAPVVLVTDSAHGPRIDAVSAVAARLGAQPSMRLADARSVAPGLVPEPSDFAADLKTLEQMTLAAQRWGPWSMADGRDAILLDVTGAVHLFGGARALLADITRRYAARGYPCRAALAPTGAAAWALARYAPDGAVLDDPDGIPARLSPLPVAALRLEADCLILLARLGLKRIGDLLAVPRDSLSRRFRDRSSPTNNPLIRLDQLTGRRHEPFIHLLADPPPTALRRLLEPILHLDLVQQVVADLSSDLATAMQARSVGARRLELRLWRVDGDAASRHVEMAAPSRDPAHLARLFADRLDDLDAGFGFDQMRLTASWTEPLDPAQDRLDTPAASGISTAMLLDRLTTRLGPDAVRSPHPVESHMPERAQRWDAPVADAPKTPVDARTGPPRPLKLLDHPEAIEVLYATPEGLPRRFRWRRELHEIVRAEGPERIAPEWWRERSTARLRDYYRIEDDRGRRFWIYRHGVAGDGRSDAPPGWFLQGLFA